MHSLVQCVKVYTMLELIVKLHTFWPGFMPAICGNRSFQHTQIRGQGIAVSESSHMQIDTQFIASGRGYELERQKRDSNACKLARNVSWAWNHHNYAILDCHLDRRLVANVEIFLVVYNIMSSALSTTSARLLPCIPRSQLATPLPFI
jgi:hypothetical protein